MIELTAIIILTGLFCYEYLKTGDLGALWASGFVTGGGLVIFLHLINKGG